jgi:hypothetical protein
VQQRHSPRHLRGEGPVHTELEGGASRGNGPGLGQRTAGAGEAGPKRWLGISWSKWTETRRIST